MFCSKTGSGASGPRWMHASVIECIEHVQSEFVSPMSPVLHCLWRNMSQCSLAHLITVPVIGRDRSVRHSNDIPHESQLVARLLCVMSSSLWWSAGPGFNSMSPDNSSSSRVRYNRLLLNLLWRLQGLGRGTIRMSFTGTRWLHHGENSIASSYRVNAVKNTAARSAHLNTFPNIFSTW